MAPIRTAAHIQLPVYLAVVKEGKKLSDFDFLNQNAKDMLNQLPGRIPDVADFVAEVGVERTTTLTLHPPNEAAASAHGHRGSRINRTYGRQSDRVEARLSIRAP